ncbi:hypothetical protein KKC97_07690 [bacterium]|nr:hypothetical protein [bacterium]MBU1637535.1 hypothetical protein [bacterium]
MNAPMPPGYLTREQIELFDRLASLVVKKRLTAPAILFLESVRPLNFVGSQAMLFFAPMVHALFTVQQYDLIQKALERRETLGYLTDLLECKEEDAARKESALREQMKREKKAKRAEKKKRIS